MVKQKSASDLIFQCADRFFPSNRNGKRNERRTFAYSGGDRSGFKPDSLAPLQHKKDRVRKIRSTVKLPEVGVEPTCYR